MTVIDNSLLACGDCIQIIANDDATGLDYHYSPEDADKREREIRDGIHRLQLSVPNGYLCVGDEYGFTWRGCDVCGQELGGDKHTVVLLGDTK